MGLIEYLFGKPLGSCGNTYVRGKTFCEIIEENVRGALEADKRQQQVSKEWEDVRGKTVFRCQDYQGHQLARDVLWDKAMDAANIHNVYLKVLKSMIKFGDTIIVKVDGTSYNVAYVGTPLGGNMISISKTIGAFK